MKVKKAELEGVQKVIDSIKTTEMFTLDNVETLVDFSENIISLREKFQKTVQKIANGEETISEEKTPKKWTQYVDLCKDVVELQLDIPYEIIISGCKGLEIGAIRFIKKLTTKTEELETV